MDEKLYSRHDGALLREWPVDTAVILKTFREDDAADAITRIEIKAQQGPSVWYKLRLNDGTTGFARADHVLREQRWQLKKRYVHIMRGLRESLDLTQSKALAPPPSGGGVIAGRECRYTVPTQRKYDPWTWAATTNLYLPAFHNLYLFVHFEGQDIFATTFNFPEKFRKGRLQYIRTTSNGYKVFRIKWEDWNQTLVVGILGRQVKFSFNDPNQSRESPFIPLCTGDQAEAVVGAAEKHILNLLAHMPVD
jgi:hypothetical protein